MNIVGYMYLKDFLLQFIMQKIILGDTYFLE